MRCEKCDAVVPPLREFCPECGTPTNRILREGRSEGRSPGRSEAELKRNRRNVFLIGGAGLLFLAIIGKANFIDIDMDSDERDTRPAIIQAQALYDAYREDDGAANERFRDREMVVTGEFVRVVPDGGGNPDLRLKTSNPERPLGADLISVSHERAAELRPGQIVTVSCQRMAGNRQERWLQNCSIGTVEDGQPTASPSPSTSSSPSESASETKSESPSPPPTPAESNSE